MNLYAIRRRNGWGSPDELQTTAGVSAVAGDKPGSGVRWIRSYVLAEEGGELLLSPRTVDMHVRNLFRKLACRSRVDAVRRAGELGLLVEADA